MNDVLVASSSESEHLDQLECIFQRLAEAGLVLTRENEHNKGFSTLITILIFKFTLVSVGGCPHNIPK